FPSRYATGCALTAPTGSIRARAMYDSQHAMRTVAPADRPPTVVNELSLRRAKPMGWRVPRAEEVKAASPIPRIAIMIRRTLNAPLPAASALVGLLLTPTTSSAHPDPGYYPGGGYYPGYPHHHHHGYYYPAYGVYRPVYPVVVPFRPVPV